MKIRAKISKMSWLIVCLTLPLLGADALNREQVGVAIDGVSINLPYEQLKQELAKKFGGINEEKTNVSFADISPFATFSTDERRKLFGCLNPIYKKMAVFNKGDGMCLLQDNTAKYILIPVGADVSAVSNYLGALQAKYKEAKIVPLPDIKEAHNASTSKKETYKNIKSFMMILDDGIIVCTKYEYISNWISDDCIMYSGEIIYFDKSKRNEIVTRLKNRK